MHTREMSHFDQLSEVQQFSIRVQKTFQTLTVFTLCISDSDTITVTWYNKHMHNMF